MKFHIFQNGEIKCEKPSADVIVTFSEGFSHLCL